MGNDKQDVLETLLAQGQPAFERWYKGDPLAYMALMADEMTYFSPFENSLLDGKKTLEATFAPLVGQIQVPSFEVLNPKLQLGEDIGVLKFNLNEHDKDGALTAGWKVTEVYRQMGDEWRMIHAHYSPIREA
jgi:ketosteroid isomerase-like protein